MPKPTYIYSTHARWYVCICSSGSPRHYWVVVHTPSHGDCRAPLPVDATAIERAEVAAEIVARFYDAEDWYRLPNEIRCRETELTAALRKIFDHVPVRTDRLANTFIEVEVRFMEKAA